MSLQTATNDIPAQAADWLVRLSEEDPAPTQQDFDDFERWQQSDPRHRQAVTSMQSLLGNLQNLPASAAHAALAAGKTESTHNHWQALAKTLCLVLALLLPIQYLNSTQTLSSWLADKRTSSQEWQSWTLSDNSTLQLSGNSAVDINFDAEQRQLRLLRGELLIDVASDAAFPKGKRPLDVITQHGRFRALGTRFVVQHSANSTVLTVLESTVLVFPAAGNPAKGIAVSSGEQLRLEAPHLHQITQLDTEKFERNWRNRQFVVSGQPLSAVLEKLAHYHKGHLLYDREALTDIEVMAVLPLDDPERALQLLSESLPIKVTQYSPWLLHIAHQQTR